jgi:hypothetical protein
MQIHWRQGLGSATAYERSVLLELETYTERLHLQEVTRSLCAASDLGIVECSDLVASARISKWGRRRGRIYAIIRASANRPGACASYRFRFNNLRSTGN